jgi:Tfp pilus assembly protein PilN
MTDENDLSFLPEDYLQRKLRRRSIAVGAGLTLAVVMGLAAMIYVSRQSLARVESAHAQVTRACVEAARQVERVRRDQDEQQRILQHAALAASLGERVPRSNILAELTNRLPEGASLVSLNLESHPRHEPAPVFNSAFDMKKANLEARRKTENNTAPGAPVIDVTVRLTGLAATDTQVAGYLNLLSRSPLFQNVHLRISETDSSPSHATSPMRRFQMEMTVNPNLGVKPTRVPALVADGGQ